MLRPARICQPLFLRVSLGSSSVTRGFVNISTLFLPDGTSFAILILF